MENSFCFKKFQNITTEHKEKKVTKTSGKNKNTKQNLLYCTKIILKKVDISSQNTNFKNIIKKICMKICVTKFTILGQNIKTDSFYKCWKFIRKYNKTKKKKIAKLQNHPTKFKKKGLYLK